MTYKFIEELKALLGAKDPAWLTELEHDQVLTPNLIGLHIVEKFPSCPTGTRNYRDGQTISWLKAHYDQT